MRLLLLLLVLLPPGILPARAQTTPAGPVLADSPAAPDTVAAIHRMFDHKRQQRTGLLVTTLGVGGLLFYTGTQAHSFDTGVALAGVGVLAVPASLVEAMLYSRYGPHREERVIADFRLHHSPRWLRRKLKDYYFAAPVSHR